MALHQKTRRTPRQARTHYAKKSRVERSKARARLQPVK